MADALLFYRNIEFILLKKMYFKVANRKRKRTLFLHLILQIMYDAFNLANGSMCVSSCESLFFISSRQILPLSKIKGSYDRLCCYLLPIKRNPLPRKMKMRLTLQRIVIHLQKKRKTIGHK